MDFKQEKSQITLIRKRIFLITLVGILTTGLVASLSTSIPFYFSARANLEQITLSSIQNQASVLDNILKKYQDLARQFTSRSEIRLRLEKYTAGQMSLEDLKAYSEPRLKDAMRLSSDLLGLIRLGVNGEVVASIGKTPPDFQADSLSNKMISVNENLPSYSLIKLNNLPVVRIQASIFSKQGEFIGQDILYFSNINLLEVLNDKLQLDARASVYLINLETKQKLVYSEQSNNLVLTQSIDPAKLSYLNEVGDCDKCVVKPEGNCKSVIFFTSLEAAGWSLVAEIPVNSFYYSVRQQVLWPLLTSVLMLALVIFAISQALQPFTRRLTNLAEALEHSTEELRLVASVFEGTREAIAVTDEKMHLIKVNLAFSQITGFSAESILGKNLQDLFYKKKAIEKLQLKIQQSLEVRDTWQGEIWYQNKTGEKLPVLQSISALMGERGEVINYIHIFNDISESKANEERINYLAHYDQLTDLPNRTLLNRRIKSAVEKARFNNQGLAILFMDLDHFKEVNDTLGHPIGDLLLQAVGQRLKAKLREQDTLGRLGGDEFLAILDHSANVDASGVVAQKIINALVQPFIIEGHKIQIGVSIGIAIYPKDGNTADELIKNADTAMYRAKDNGRNIYCYFSEAENI